MSAMPPLSHHEILALVAPFSRSGRHVDLAASDRLARTLRFKPLPRQLDAPEAAPLHETLQLDSLDERTWRLTRTLRRADGLAATLQVQGAQPAELLARIDSVPPQRHFDAGAGYLLARSYDLDAPDAGTREPLLRRAELRADGLVLTMTLPLLRGVAADLALEAADGARLDLPEDLLAVLGWDWSRLQPRTDGWKAKLRLRGSLLRRTRTAEAALHLAGAHLARLAAEAPAQFHERHRWARWGVVLRRLIPTLTALALIAAAVALPRLEIEQTPGLWLALHYVPIAILADRKSVV
jgi:hypothetical protein